MTKEEAWNSLMYKTLDNYFSRMNRKDLFDAGWNAAINSLAQPVDPIPYHEIIDFLNKTAGKEFKAVTAAKEKIKARWNEGYRLDDFKHVIKTKCDQWIHDKTMCIYIRPTTLFGTKFDAYLNETPKVRSALEEWQ